jgi:hypothetical protein
MNRAAITADMAKPIVALRDGERNGMSAGWTEIHGILNRESLKGELDAHRINDEHQCAISR